MKKRFSARSYRRSKYAQELRDEESGWMRAKRRYRGRHNSYIHEQKSWKAHRRHQYRHRRRIQKHEVMVPVELIESDRFTPRWAMAEAAVELVNPCNYPYTTKVIYDNETANTYVGWKKEGCTWRKQIVTRWPDRVGVLVTYWELEDEH